MKNHQVHIFHIDRDARPGDRAQPAGDFEVSAESHVHARTAARARLEAEGRTVRSLSFLEDGGIAAVVTQPPPAPSPANVARAQRGG
jgi:hypothetical protein